MKFTEIMRLPEWRKVIATIVFGIVLLLLARALHPITERPSPRELYDRSPDVRETATLVKASHNDKFIDIPVSILVQASVIVAYDSAKGDAEIHFVEAKMRWDNVIVAIGGLVLLGLLLRQFVAPGVRPQPPERRENAEIPSAGAPSPPSDVQSPETLLWNDVRRAHVLADHLYSRSNLLLWSGIVMSFVGIGVFWVSAPVLPSTAHVTLLSYLPLMLRPLGMLIFVESVAWFLLRQYRSLIEDFKGFNRLYLRRVNLLVALKLATATPARLSAVLSAILNDDLSGRLAPGESTESIEAIKHLEQNPVSHLGTALESFSGRHGILRAGKLAARRRKRRTRE